MSEFSPTPHRRERRKSSRRPVLRALLALGVLLLAFLLGIAFARTLDERPEQGEPVTDVRTLTPLPLEPPARTVTVTVTTP